MTLEEALAEAKRGPHWPGQDWQGVVATILNAAASGQLTPFADRKLAVAEKLHGVYVASKAKYGPEWVAARQAGYPIISSWIDQSGVGETSNWPTLWWGCISEASACTALVLVCRPGDVLKGAWAEVGAALAKGVPVFAVGIDEFSIRHHPGVTVYQSEDAAFAAALTALKEVGHA